MRIWNDRDALFGAYYRRTRGAGPPGKDKGDLGMVDTQECDRDQELLGTLHIFQEIREGILSVDSPPYRSHQEGCLRLERGSIGHFQEAQGGYELMPSSSYA